MKKTILLLLVLLFLSSCDSSNNKTNYESGYEVNTLTVNERTLRYLKFGEGDKNLVILPGLSVYYVTDSAETIVDSYESFTEEYTIYLLDVPDEIPDGYSMNDMVADMKCAIDELKLKNIDLYATSMGGMEAIILAGQYPELVNKMAICSSSYENNELSTNVFDTWITLAKQEDGRALLQNIAERIYSQNTIDTYGEALYAGGDELSAETLTRFARITTALINSNVYEDAKMVTCETYVIGSEGDRVFGYEETIQLANTIDCDYYLYDASYGHAVYDEANDYKEHMYNYFVEEQ